ncbi:MAG: ROK family protein, partial [Acutalibacteraceae bacterium]
LTALEAVKAAKLDISEIESVGIGSPGTVNPDSGIIEYSNNISFENVPAVKMMRERIDKPCFIGNDANVAAYGEYLAGCGRGTKNFIAITLGTGVGSGIIIDGKIYTGTNYAGAEIGHTVIIDGGTECTCGRKGCWEAYASATGCIRQTKEMMKKHPESLMWKLCGGDETRMTARTSFDAMRKGDKYGKIVVENYIRYIGIGLVNVINIFQPEIVCIGGGICNEGDTLLVPLRKYVSEQRYSKNCSVQTEIVKAVLGNDAGIIGAAMLGK